MISRETLLFLQQILNAQQLSAGAPDFAEAAQAVVRAKAELAEAIAAAGE